ncbi:Ribonuclease 3 [Dissostichus eleginoides]|uniref:Ribonuclease 3 n=1 Tax=Dissostichus eleginoides TaxID=100907 RepID=A0AAD9B501_DISEL|nr:Ribonuclease 3 [Dissostichus eleginoides]
MISYVECLGGEGASPIGGGGAAARCWNGISDEDREELLPPKMAALQPKTEGSLRRRLLSAKLRQQQQDAILALNSGVALFHRGPIKSPRSSFVARGSTANPKRLMETRRSLPGANDA